MKTQTSCITIFGVKLKVAYIINKPYKGARDSLGVPLEPDEEGGIEIAAVFHGSEDITELVAPEIFRMIEYKLEEEINEY